MFPIVKTNVTRAPGNGRNSRRKRRLQAKQRGDQDLLQAPFLHGHTRPGRLELIDKAWILWVTLLHPVQFKSTNILVIFDIGIGDQPDTTFEWSVVINDWIQKHNELFQQNIAVKTATAQESPGPMFQNTPYAFVVGTEIDWNRLERAKQFTTQRADSDNVSTRYVHVNFEWCGTNFKLPQIATVYNYHTSNSTSQQICAHFIRAMNVFRDYHIHDTCVGIMKLYQQLHSCPSGSPGMLLEGSANTTGSIAVALVLLRHKNDNENEKLQKSNYAVNVDRIPVSGVIFTINLDKVSNERKVDTDNDYVKIGIPQFVDVTKGSSKTSSPPHWFSSTLPRLWRHCFDNNEERQCTNLPMWSQSMYKFLSTWHQCAEECIREPHNKGLLSDKDTWFESTQKLAKQYDLCMDGITDGVLIWINPSGLYIPIPSETLDQSSKGTKS